MTGRDRAVHGCRGWAFVVSGALLVPALAIAPDPVAATMIAEVPGCGPVVSVVRGPSAVEALSVAVGHPIYDDLEHFRALGYWRGGLELLPMTRGQAAEALATIRRTAAIRPLGSGDRRRLESLERYLGSPAVSPGAAGEAATSADTPSADTQSTDAPSANRSADDPPVARRTGPPVDWQLAAGLRFAGSATDLETLIDLHRRPRTDPLFVASVDAAIGEHLVVESRFYEDYSRLTRDAGDGWVDNLPVDGRGILTDPSARNDRAVLGVDWGWGNVRIGREDRHWGVGRWGTLFLSENPFPLDGVALGLHTRWVSAASLVAQSWRDPEGWFAAHRIEVHPPIPVRLGIFEAAAWGGRGIDPAYANPVGFLVAMTQDIVDRSGIDDKKVIGADVVALLPPVTLYGELLLNRLVSLDAATEGEESRASTFAQLAGARWASPLGWSGASLEAEYAHLDPEVYFHHDGDTTRSLLSEGEWIGHWAGANTDVARLAVHAPPGAYGRVALDFEQVRWGLAGGGRGADAGFFGLRRSEKEWITGDREIERRVRLLWSRCGWAVPLPGRWDTAVAVARVDRIFRESAGSSSAARARGWAEEGWQLEVRVGWTIELGFGHGAGASGGSGADEVGAEAVGSADIGAGDVKTGDVGAGEE